MLSCLWSPGTKTIPEESSLVTFTHGNLMRIYYAPYYHLPLSIHCNWYNESRPLMTMTRLIHIVPSITTTLNISTTTIDEDIMMGVMMILNNKVSIVVLGLLFRHSLFKAREELQKKEMRGMLYKVIYIIPKVRCVGEMFVILRQDKEIGV